MFADKKLKEAENPICDDSIVFVWFFVGLVEKKSYKMYIDKIFPY